MFNCVLDTGIIPDAWVLGVIVPIYKCKGDMQKPEKYRPITILSCIGKVFTSVINEGLTSYLDNNELLLKTKQDFERIIVPLIIYFYYKCWLNTVNVKDQNCFVPS